VIQPGVDEKYACAHFERVTSSLVYTINTFCLFTVCSSMFSGLECTQQTEFDLILVRDGCTTTDPREGPSRPSYLSGPPTKVQLGAHNLLAVLRNIGAYVPIVLMCGEHDTVSHKGQELTIASADSNLLSSTVLGNSKSSKAKRSSQATAYGNSYFVDEANVNAFFGYMRLPFRPQPFQELVQKLRAIKAPPMEVYSQQVPNMFGSRESFLQRTTFVSALDNCSNEQITRDSNKCAFNSVVKSSASDSESRIINTTSPEGGQTSSPETFDEEEDEVVVLSCRSLSDEAVSKSQDRCSDGLRMLLTQPLSPLRSPNQRVHKHVHASSDQHFSGVPATTLSPARGRRKRSGSTVNFTADLLVTASPTNAARQTSPPIYSSSCDVRRADRGTLGLTLAQKQQKSMEPITWSLSRSGTLSNTDYALLNDVAAQFGFLNNTTNTTKSRLDQGGCSAHQNNRQRSETIVSASQSTASDGKNARPLASPRSAAHRTTSVTGIASSVQDVYQDIDDLFSPQLKRARVARKQQSASTELAEVAPRPYATRHCNGDRRCDWALTDDYGDDSSGTNSDA
jgi:hypothetical protein